MCEKVKQCISKLLGEKRVPFSFTIKILFIFAICFVIMFYIAGRLKHTDRDNMFDSVMAASAFAIPITLGWMQYKTEKGRERLEQSNKETIIAMEAKLEEMRKLQASLEAKQKEMKKLQADAERTLEAIKKVKITSSNFRVSGNVASLDLSNPTIGDMLR